MTIFIKEYVSGFPGERVLENLVALADVKLNQLLQWDVNGKLIWGVVLNTALIGEKFHFAYQCAAYILKEAGALDAGEEVQVNVSNNTIETYADDERLGFCVLPAATDDESAKIVIGERTPISGTPIDIIDSVDAATVILRLNELLAELRLQGKIGPAAT